MILCDVNVLVYAHKENSPRHDEHRAFLTGALNGVEPFGVSDIVLSGFLRIVTHPRIFTTPSGWADARDFVQAVRLAPNAVPVVPSRRHWRVFEQLVEQVGARGNAIPDAYLAALAIDVGADWVSADRGFARYPGLRWRHPLDRPIG